MEKIDTKISYEEASKQLDQIITELESGNLSMDKALENFEKGKALAQVCYSNLDKVKGKLTEVNEILSKLVEEED